MAPCAICLSNTLPCMPADRGDVSAIQPDARQPYVTYGLIAACVAVAIISRLGEDLRVLTWLTFADLREFEGSIPGDLDAIQHGQVWRLFTPILIHFGILHLVLNMLWLKDLGGLIERLWSPRTLVVLVAGSAAVSNVAQYLINWDFRSGLGYANALSGGMSGVVYCLLGYLWIRGRNDGSGVRLNQQTVWMMLGWLVVCFTGAFGPIANTAHLVGLLVGMGWGWVAARRVAGHATAE